MTTTGTVCKQSTTNRSLLMDAGEGGDHYVVFPKKQGRTVPLSSRSTLSKPRVESSSSLLSSLSVLFPNTIKDEIDIVTHKGPNNNNNNNNNGINLDDFDDGMPWTQTIGTSPLHAQTPHPHLPSTSRALLYMPFWINQLEFMKRSLTNLRRIPLPPHFAYNENLTKKNKHHRIVSRCYASEEYRKIRMTYYDAGDDVQVFNSLWYPNEKEGEEVLPVLGVDLLSFGRKRFLVVVDFQPVHDEEEERSISSTWKEFEDKVLPKIRSRYPSLQGKMSDRFYDEHQFFSSQMLFGRLDGKHHDDNEGHDGTSSSSSLEKSGEDLIWDELMPAFMDYMKEHLNMVRQSSRPSVRSMEQRHLARERILKRQEAYDVYSARRDPALAMFSRVYGEEWADSYVHDFLFDLSRRGTKIQ